MAASLEARKAHAAVRWTALADRVKTITPETVARFALGAAALGVAMWGVIGSWPALAPFAVGIVIAYAVLPIANRLDRFMPRALAALLAELLALAVLGGVIVLVVPPLLRGLVQVAGLLPTPDRVSAGLDNLQNALGQLQEPVKSIALAVATQTAANLQAVIDSAVNGTAQFVTQQILGVAGTLSFILGLLVIPAWILTMVSDDQHIRRRAASVISPGLRPDILALARIADRAFSTFLRIRVLLAIVSAVLIWAGLEMARSLGVAEFPYAVTAGILLGTFQLIPEVGFFLGFFPILLVLAAAGPIPAATVAVVYWASVRIASSMVETRVSRGVLDVHPGLLIPGIVVLSQFGIGWTLAAAPLIAIGRDTIRYLVGRMAEPPQPAGVLPGDRQARAASAPISVPVPSAYRSLATPRPVLTPSITAPAAPLPEPTFTPSAPAIPTLVPPVTERSIAS